MTCLHFINHSIIKIYVLLFGLSHIYHQHPAIIGSTANIQDWGSLSEAIVVTMGLNCFYRIETIGTVITYWLFYLFEWWKRTIHVIVIQLRKHRIILKRMSMIFCKDCRKNNRYVTFCWQLLSHSLYRILLGKNSVVAKISSECLMITRNNKKFFIVSYE